MTECATEQRVLRLKSREASGISALLALVGLAALCGCGAARPSTVAESARAIVHSATAAERIRDEADAVVPSIAAYLGIPLPDRPVRIVHFSWRFSRRRYMRSVCPRLAGASAGCFLNAEGEFEIALSGSWEAAETKRLLRHELSHYVVASRWPDIPPWLDEGLSRFFELGPPYGGIHPKSLASLRRRLRNPAPDMIETLVRAGPGRLLTPAQYDEAWGLTWFLLTRPEYGPTAIMAYAEDIQWPDDPSERFRLHFGLSPSEIQSNWRRAILAAAP